MRDTACTRLQHFFSSSLATKQDADHLSADSPGLPRAKARRRSTLCRPQQQQDAPNCTVGLPEHRRVCRRSCSWNVKSSQQRPQVGQIIQRAGAPVRRVVEPSPDPWPSSIRAYGSLFPLEDRLLFPRVRTMMAELKDARWPMSRLPAATWAGGGATLYVQTSPALFLQQNPVLLVWRKVASIWRHRGAPR